jgi:mono/diheme cytochrome c family protein
MLKKIETFVALSFLVLGVGFYLLSPKKVGATANGDPKAGAEVHKENCAKCHGPGGKGDGPAGKLLKTKPADWTDRSKMSKISDDELFNVIQKGGGAVGKSKLMPAFAEKLSDDQIRNVIAFIRSL